MTSSKLSDTDRGGDNSEKKDDFQEADEFQPGQFQLPSPNPTNVALPESPPRSREISADFDEENILPEGVTRRRRRIDRREAYATALNTSANGELNAFHNAFASAFSTSVFRISEDSSSDILPSTLKIEERIHRDDLLPEPQSYHQMLKHPHAKGFKQAAEVEITALKDKNTWTKVPFNHATKAGKIPISTTWVFKYKFYEKGYLVKYKARLCARGDLQHTEQDTFAATLAARIFRSLMALVAAFDLKTRQYDAVNAFANSPIDEATYCKIPDG